MIHKKKEFQTKAEIKRIFLLLPEDIFALISCSAFFMINPFSVARYVKLEACICKCSALFMGSFPGYHERKVLVSGLTDACPLTLQPSLMQ